MTTALNTMQPARGYIYCPRACWCLSTLYASETFNTELVELDNPGMGKADLSAFESGSQAPGTYHVDIILDDRLLETRDIRFMAVKDANGSETLQPCLSIGQLKAWGVKTALFPQLDAGEGECADLRAIPQASADFQFGAQRGDQHPTGGHRPASERLRSAGYVG